MRMWLTLALVSLCSLAAGDEPKSKLVFGDRFESKLADGWSWTKENPQTWRIENGALMIKTAPGNIWDKSADNVLWRAQAVCRRAPRGMPKSPSPTNRKPNTSRPV